MRSGSDRPRRHTDQTATMSTSPRCYTPQQGIHPRAAVAAAKADLGDVGVGGDDPALVRGDLLKEVELVIDRRGSISNGPGIKDDALGHAARVARDGQVSRKSVYDRVAASPRMNG